MRTRWLFDVECQSVLLRSIQGWQLVSLGLNGVLVEECAMRQYERQPRMSRFMPSDGPSLAVVAIMSCSRLRSGPRTTVALKLDKKRGAYINIAKRIICLSGAMCPHNKTIQNLTLPIRSPSLLFVFPGLTRAGDSWAA